VLVLDYHRPQLSRCQANNLVLNLYLRSGLMWRARPVDLVVGTSCHPGLILEQPGPRLFLQQDRDRTEISEMSDIADD
jgi:hypothetical protein